MIHRLIRRLALAALDCGPSTLRHALEGDADASRVLASLGVTSYDLTAIADARAARRRDGYQPRPKPGADPAPLTPPPMQSGVVRPGADYPSFGCVPEPPRAVPVFGPWRDVVGSDGLPDECRLQIGESAPRAPAAIYASAFEVSRNNADRWAREQGWVLLDAEPESLAGCKIAFSRFPTGRLCYLTRDTTPYLRALLYSDGGWSIRYFGAVVAHGPQTGPEGERLLRAALTALGVEVLDA